MSAKVRSSGERRVALRTMICAIVRTATKVINILHAHGAVRMTSISGLRVKAGSDQGKLAFRPVFNPGTKGVQPSVPLIRTNRVQSAYPI